MKDKSILKWVLALLLTISIPVSHGSSFSVRSKYFKSFLHIPCSFYYLKTDRGIFKTFRTDSERGNNTHFIPKGHVWFPIWGTLEQDQVPCYIHFTRGAWMGSRPQWGYLPRAVQVLSPNNPMIPLCTVPVTFSVTHFSALGRGWHGADFMDGELHVLGSALMGCNSLCSHQSTIRDLSLGLSVVIGGVLQGLLLCCSVLSCSAAITERLLSIQPVHREVGREISET